MKGADYGALFLVITLGVAAGNLASSLVQTAIAAYGVRQVAVAAQQQMQDRLAREQDAAAQRRAQAVAQRTASPQGMALARACEDWRRAERDMPNHTTTTETRRHCDRYARFVETGTAGP